MLVGTGRAAPPRGGTPCARYTKHGPRQVVARRLLASAAAGGRAPGAGGGRRLSAVSVAALMPTVAITGVKSSAKSSITLLCSLCLALFSGLRRNGPLPPLAPRQPSLVASVARLRLLLRPMILRTSSNR